MYTVFYFGLLSMLDQAVKAIYSWFLKFLFFELMVGKIYIMTSYKFSALVVKNKYNKICIAGLYWQI